MLNKPTYRRPAAAVDFDGTIAQYDGWKGEDQVGEPYPGAIDFIKRLSEKYDIYIFSARASSDIGKSTIIKWLVEHKLMGIVKEVTNQKKYNFSIFIDDRAFRCDGSTESYSFLLEALGI